MRKILHIFLCLLLMATIIAGLPDRSDGVLDKIKAGLQYATNYLETAKDIADLVAKSLGHGETGRKGEEEDTRKREKGNFGPSNVMSAFFRLMGLDSQKVTAIAVNSVIFLAQMISSLFGLKPSMGNLGRSFEDEDDFSSWYPDKLLTESKNAKIQELIVQAQDERLSNRLIEMVDGTQFACTRLLLCKVSPVIRAAQNYLKENKGRGNRYSMTSWLPTDIAESAGHLADSYILLERKYRGFPRDNTGIR